jgi:hypothetical protein
VHPSLMKPPEWAAFLCTHIFLPGATSFSTEVFNMFVENTVEKRLPVDVNGSSSDGSALCTGVVAGTLVV